MTNFKPLLLACALSAAAFGSAQLQNGNFLSNVYGFDGVTGGIFATVLAGDSTSISDWTVGAGINDPGTGSVDLINTYWQNPAGSLSIDMDGLNPGSITQTDNLNPGTYTLSFWLSGNPDGPPSQKVLALLGNLPLDTFTYNIGGNSHSDMMYQLESVTFYASGPTTFTLSSGDPANEGGNIPAFGPVIGGLSLQPAAAPEPFTMGLGIAGIGMFIRRRIKARA